MNKRLYRFHYRIVSLVLIVLFLFGQVGRASAASIIYVKPNAAGANNGTSWANAYKNLQVALAAATPGNQLWVAAGTYYPTNGFNRSLYFRLRTGIALYGGFAGNETLLSQRKPAVHLTILSGNIGDPGTSTTTRTMSSMAAATAAPSWTASGSSGATPMRVRASTPRAAAYTPLAAPPCATSPSPTTTPKLAPAYIYLPPVRPSRM